MTSRGGDCTKKQQKHVNKTKFHLKFNDKALKMKTNTPLDRLCGRCLEQIKWKLEFGKYKPLSAMSKCVKCSRKNIIKAYRQCCDACSDEMQVCSKCLEQKELMQDENEKPKEDGFIKERQEMQLRKMRERSRKRVVRLIEKGQVQFNGEVFVDVETGQEVEDIQFKKDDMDDQDLSWDEEDEDDFGFKDQCKREDE